MGCLGMVEFELKYVDAQGDRRGQVLYYYFRRGGRRWRLPGEPLSEGFMAEYRRLLAATAPTLSSVERPTNFPGSFGALVRDFFAERKFRVERRPNTQKMYRQIIEPLVERHGDKPVALLERRHIKEWRDARAPLPPAHYCRFNRDIWSNRRRCKPSFAVTAASRSGLVAHAASGVFAYGRTH